MSVTKETIEGHHSSALPERSEFEIAQKLELRRTELLREADIEERSTAHFKRPVENDFTKEERATSTLLFGGLTLRHDSLVKAAAEGLGYRVDMIPTPVKPDFQAGKEYGNNGQCNPTYFTVGSLVNYLKRLRDEEGLSTESILKNYSFVTASACGPCRFGMYEAEYRLALRNSGFDGFRVLLFQQKGGMAQSAEDAGLALNLEFALALLNALLVGDLLNEVAYQIRPYETEAGRTNSVFEKVVSRMQTSLRRENPETKKEGGLIGVVSKLLSPFAKSDDVSRILSQLFREEFVSTMKECRTIIDEEIEVDFLRPRPICKVTGEFWAQTTEGDGNFHMFEFLESQGAEVLVEPIMTWINYLIAQGRSKQSDLKGLGMGSDAWSKLKAEADCRKKQLILDAASRVLNREYDRMRNALGGTAHAQIDQLELQRIADPYYNRKSGGGEGHLEVAKNIYYSNKSLAHMVISLKPFGCMPSTQSDGAQAAVMSHYPDMIYIPIETSGEGDVNAHSRAQMALGEAKLKCKREFKECVESTGYSLDEIREYCASHQELRRPLQRIAHQEGIVGRGANFALHVGALMKADSSFARPGVETAVAAR